MSAHKLSIREHINRVPETLRKILVPRLVGREGEVLSSTSLFCLSFRQSSTARLSCLVTTGSPSSAVPPHSTVLVLNIPVHPPQRIFNSPVAPTINGEDFLLMPEIFLPCQLFSTLLLSSFQTLGAGSRNNVFTYKILISMIIF